MWGLVVLFKDWLEKNKEKLQSISQEEALEFAWSEGQAVLADWLDKLNVLPEEAKDAKSE